MWRGKRGSWEGEELMTLRSIGLCCVLAGIACGEERDEPPVDEIAVPDTKRVHERDPAGGERELADTLVMQAGGALAQRPVAPLRIEGACPFECCTYGDWTTTAETTVYKEPDPGSGQW